MKRILLAALFGALSLTGNARALTCYALNGTSQLIKFDSATPGTVPVGYPLTVTNLGGYVLVGMDIRTTVQTIGAANPGVGTLWAIGLLPPGDDTAQLFVINPNTGAATPVGAPFAVVNEAGTSGWGFGFDPATDRIRLTGSRINYQIDPNTVSVVRQTNIVAAGNVAPAINGAAYTTTSFGGTSQVYALDNGNHTLLVSTNLANGILSAVGSGLGFTNTAGNGLDIFQGTTLWAGTAGGTAALYTINRSTGAATLVGNIMGNPSSIFGLAIVPPSFPPVLPVTIKVKGSKNITTTATSLKIKGTAASDAGIKLVQYKIGKGKFKKAKKTTKWNFTAKLKPGLNKITVQATGGNDVVSKPVKIKVTVVAPL